MFFSTYHCKGCTGRLSRDEKMHSLGRCPLCGHKEAGAGTVVSTFEKCVEQITLRPWWAFWRGPRYRYRGVPDSADGPSRAIAELQAAIDCLEKLLLEIMEKAPLKLEEHLLVDHIANTVEALQNRIDRIARGHY